MNQTLWNRIVSHCSSLYRDRENGQLLGVCAGLASRYGLNPLGVRVVAVVALILMPVATGIFYVALGMTLRDAPLSFSGGEQERGFWRGTSNNAGARR